VTAATIEHEAGAEAAPVEPGSTFARRTAAFVAVALLAAGCAGPGAMATFPNRWTHLLSSLSEVTRWAS